MAKAYVVAVYNKIIYRILAQLWVLTELKHSQ